MSNQEHYMFQVKELIKVYGLEAFAKVLGKTERGVQYWLAENNPKKPSPKTQEKIRELFMNHKAGRGILKPQGGEVIENGHNQAKEDYLSGRNLENFSEAHRVLAAAIAHVLPKSSTDQVLAPRIVDLIQEFAGGKKLIQVDDLVKELRKALMRDNSYM